MTETARELFQGKQWSKTLKGEADKFLMFHAKWTRDMLELSKALEILIDMAIEEGFEDAKETVNDWYEPEPREPQHDEGRD